MIATDLGNPPAVWVLTGSSVQLSSRPGQNSDLLLSWRVVTWTGNRTVGFWPGCISNDPSFRQKHPGVLDGSDGSDGTSYPLTENYTLHVAQATGRVAHVPPVLFGDVYAPSERHVCYTLRSGCSYAEAVYTTPGFFGNAAGAPGIIATTYRSTIFKTYAFSLYSPLCIYVSI